MKALARVAVLWALASIQQCDAISNGFATAGKTIPAFSTLGQTCQDTSKPPPYTSAITTPADVPLTTYAVATTIIGYCAVD